jgi:Cu+-exporting ATPase
VGTAYGYSLTVLIAGERLPAAFRSAHGEVPVYFEAAAMIVTLVLAGQVLEAIARRRTGDALASLMSLAPETATIVDADGSERQVHICRLRPGDTIRVRPGDRIAADGEVVSGSGAVDESMISGEPVPVAKARGDAVIGATINTDGTFLARIERTGEHTVLSRVIELVSSAQQSRAPIQRIADRAAAWFTPAVLVVAVVTLAGWAYWADELALARGIMAAVAVLIVACPCALGLAAPMSITVASGLGARLGILFRNAECIETLGSINALVVDKTGTLTEGRPAVVGVEPAGSLGREDLLQLAASVERSSTHPLARACVRAAADGGLPLEEPADVVSEAGRGLRAKLGQRDVAIGNRAYLRAAGAEPIVEENDELTEILVAVDGEYAGRIRFDDPIKSTSQAALRALTEDGVRVVMATGDKSSVARRVAEALGITDARAETTPAGKAELITELRAQGYRVAMAGDGINDAPALAAADVGISMGAGADVAIESAGITLMHGDLLKIVDARRLSRATMHNIRQNLFFAFVYNTMAIPIASGLLYPLTGLLLNPAIAGAAMSASSLSVITNALRLRRWSLTSTSAA